MRIVVFPAMWLKYGKKYEIMKEHCQHCTAAGFDAAGADILHMTDS